MARAAGDSWAVRGRLRGRLAVAAPPPPRLPIASRARGTLFHHSCGRAVLKAAHKCWLHKQPRCSSCTGGTPVPAGVAFRMPPAAGISTIAAALAACAPAMEPSR